MKLCVNIGGVDLWRVQLLIIRMIGVIGRLRVNRMVGLVGLLRVDTAIVLMPMLILQIVLLLLLLIVFSKFRPISIGTLLLLLVELLLRLLLLPPSPDRSGLVRVDAAAAMVA